MECPDCNGTGEVTHGKRCFLCNGNGQLCDICGDPVNDFGENVCNRCHEE